MVVCLLPPPLSCRGGAVGQEKGYCQPSHTREPHEASPQQTLTAQTQAPRDRRPQALVVEDVREATSVLTDNGYDVTRLTYAELMSTSGDEIVGRLVRKTHT